MIIDFETHLITPGNMLPRIVSLQCCDRRDETAIFLRDGARSFMNQLLSSGETIIGHNIAFDMGCVMTNWPELTPKVIAAYDANRVRCTMLWAMLQHISLGMNTNKRPKGYWGLGGCCDRVGVIHADKESVWRLRYAELENVSLSDWPTEALEYALLDAISNKQLTDRLPNDLPDVAEQSRWAMGLTLSSAYGILTDQPAVARWATQKETIKVGLEVILKEHSLIRSEGTRDMIAIQKRIVDAYGLEKAPKTKPSKSHPHGQVKTSAEVCRDSKDPILGSMAEYLTVTAALNRELPILQAPIVHTRYGLAASGRSTSFGPNLQNMTKASGSRLCFMPRPGNVYVIIDFGGLELGTLGQLCSVMGCGDGLANAVLNGKDPHRMMAASILNVSYEEAIDAPNFRDMRQLSKPANFGYPGGLGPQAFVDYAWKQFSVRITLAESKKLKRQWSKRWPEVRAYQKLIDKWISGMCLRCNVPVAGNATCPQCGDTIECGILRQYRSGRHRGGMTYTQACNTLFQGLGGDVTKDALWRLTKAGYTVVAFIHDEYLIEVPREYALEAALDIQQICESVTRDWLPSAPSRAEPVLATRWVKDDPLIVDGHLTIIEDRAT